MATRFKAFNKETRYTHSKCGLLQVTHLEQGCTDEMLMAHTW